MTGKTAAEVPAVRCRARKEPRQYDVQTQEAPGRPWVTVGVVARFGSLPSMQRWEALPDGATKWTLSRSTRKTAVNDLLAALQPATNP